jgi:hypothetical protein
MRTVVFLTSIMITSGVFLVAFCEAEFSTPVRDPEEIPVANKMEYGPSWTFQKASLPQHEQNFWRILAIVFPSLVSIFIYLLKYCYLQWVSSRDDETKYELSHSMMLEKAENFVQELRGTLKFMQGFKERRGQSQNEADLLKTVKMQDKHHDRFLHDVDLFKQMTKADCEQHDQFENEMVSIKKMMQAQDKRRLQLQNELDSFKEIMKAEYKRRAVFQKKIDCMKTMRMKVENERLAQAQKEADSIKIIAFDSVKKMEVEKEHLAHSRNEVNSAKKMKPTEETVGNPAYMKSPVKMERPRKNCIVASKATGEKRKAVPMNKVRVGLAPPPNLKAVRAKVMSWSNHRASESRVKIHNEKLDYSNVQAKIKLRRKTAMQGDGDKGLQQNESALQPCGREGYQVWFYSLKKMEVEGEHLARSPNEVESAKNMKPTEETVGDPAYMESPVKMERPKKNCIVASKATGEKRKAVPMNKVRVGLAPPPNLKAVRAKVVCWSNHRASESRVKIHNEKLDYSKIQAKIKLRRKTAMQGDGDKSLQENESALQPCGMEGNQAWFYCPL